MLRDESLGVALLIATVLLFTLRDAVAIVGGRRTSIALTAAATAAFLTLVAVVLLRFAVIR